LLGQNLFQAFFRIRYLIGIFFIIFGICLNNIWVPIRFKKEKTTFDPNAIPRKLVMDGPFRFTRNPTYLGMVLIMIGLSILLGVLSTFIIPVIFIILTDRTVIRLEERKLEKKFGKKYLKYKRRVRRWI